MLQQAYLMSHFEQPEFAWEWGCLTEGSNQVGVRITAFMWLNGRTRIYRDMTLSCCYPPAKWQVIIGQVPAYIIHTGTAFAAMAFQPGVRLPFVWM